MPWQKCGLEADDPRAGLVELDGLDPVEHLLVLPLADLDRVGTLFENFRPERGALDA